jgi:hypothetical protein
MGTEGSNLAPSASASQSVPPRNSPAAGAWGTTFWVDPKERLIAIQMIQTPTGLNSAYRHAFRNLTYAGTHAQANQD